ncbi:hypothetical protein ACTXT7_011316 [Hymenolepis weldensis]
MRTKFPAIVMVFGVVKSSEGHVMTPQSFPLGLRVNADADAYVKTLQIIIKLPWILSAANGGRPYVFQLDSPQSYGVLKTQDYLDCREFSFCQSKLMAAS